MTTLEQLQAIVRDYTGDDSLTITNETRLLIDAGLDSYDLASLLGTVEERFDVDISNRVAAQMRTIGDLVMHIEQKPMR